MTPATSLHLLVQAAHLGDEWRYACACGAWFESPDRDEAVEAFRRHRSEPQQAEVVS